MLSLGRQADGSAQPRLRKEETREVEETLVCWGLLWPSMFSVGSVSSTQHNTKPTQNQQLAIFHIVH